MNAVLKIILKIDKVLQASFTKIDKAWYDKKRSRPAMRARNKIVQNSNGFQECVCACVSALCVRVGVCVCVCVCLKAPKLFGGGGGSTIIDAVT